jgi:adenylyl-sulfate kinase
MPKGFTLWFTGLPGTGKSTLAGRVGSILRERGLRVEVLDGDVVRTNLSKGLGFSKEDRDTHIRRIGFVCHLLSRNDVVAIAAAISPYKTVREENRRLIGRFVEIYCQCDMETLKSRDPKGLYERALRGEIQNFTGVSDPYEPPDAPEVTVDTGREGVEASVGKIVAALEALGYLPADDPGYTAEEEERILGRLRELGYLKGAPAPARCGKN